MKAIKAYMHVLFSLLYVKNELIPIETNENMQSMQLNPVNQN